MRDGSFGALNLERQAVHARQDALNARALRVAQRVCDGDINWLLPATWTRE